MNIKIKQLDLHALPGLMRRALKLKTLRDRGWMAMELDKAVSLPDSYFAFTAEEKDKIVGWALFNKDANSAFYPPFLFIYVLKRYRRKGIGTKLVNIVKKKAKKEKVKHITIFPRDRENTEFFRSVGARLDKEAILV